MRERLGRIIVGVFAVLALSLPLNGAVAHQTVVACPQQCSGLTSGDWQWWIYGCWELPPQCQSSALMSRVRFR